MPNANHKNVTRAFEEFYDERFPTDERDLSPRQQSATILAGKVKRVYCPMLLFDLTSLMGSTPLNNNVPS